MGRARRQGRIGQVERPRWRLRRGLGPVRAVMRHAAVAPDGVWHLHAGKFDADGMPPIIGSINGFHQVIHRLPQAKTFADWAIIGDLPAGARQLAFRWAPYTDTFVVMVAPSAKAVLTGRRLAAILRSEGSVAVLPVANKVTSPDDLSWLEGMLGEPLAAAIPADCSAAIAERAGAAPIYHAPGSPAVRAIEAPAGLLEARATPRAEREAA